MKYKIKVGNKYLVGENVQETIKGTVRGDTTAVYSRFVGEMSAYEFCNTLEAAEDFDRVTAADYVRGLMERQNYGFYLGEIKLIDASAEETVAHCNVEQNARIIAHIMEFDSQNMIYDWYEQYIQQSVEREMTVRNRAYKLTQEITALIDSSLKWNEIAELVKKRASELADDCCGGLNTHGGLNDAH